MACHPRYDVCWVSSEIANAREMPQFIAVSRFKKPRLRKNLGREWLSPAPLPANVTVRAPARLHLGFLDLNGGLGRRFGSIGLALNRPKTSLTLSAAPQMRATRPAPARGASPLITH